MSQRRSQDFLREAVGEEDNVEGRRGWAGLHVTATTLLLLITRLVLYYNQHLTLKLFNASVSVHSVTVKLI